MTPINISYRITLEMIITEKEITLMNVGNHDEGVSSISCYDLVMRNMVSRQKTTNTFKIMVDWL